MNAETKYKELRKKAEQFLRQKGTAKSEEYFNDIEKLIEELNIHQIELEMQAEELQHSNELITKEHEKFQQLYFNAPVAYFTLNKNGNIYQLNKLAAELIGLPIHSIYNTSLFPFIHELYKQEYAKIIKNTLKSDTIEHGEIVIINRTKQNITVSIQAQAYFDHQFNQKLCRCAFIDTTKQKQAEKELVQSQIKFKSIFDILTVGISITDEIGNIIDCNKVSEQILGVTKEQHLKRNYAGSEWKIIRPDFSLMPPNEFASVRALKEKKSIYNVEMGIVKSENEITWISVNATPLNLEGYGAVITYVDITERKKEEEKRVVFNRNFEAFLNQTTDFVYFKDINSHFLFCSQTLANITGHKHWKEMIGKHDFDVFPEDIAKIYYQEELPVFAEGKALINKIDPYYDASGQKGFVLTNKWALFDDKNEIVGIFGISRDITERIKGEQKIKESEEKLKDLNATKDKLFTIIAHDLRSPFNSILGYSDLLNSNLKNYDIKKSEKFVSIIFSTAKNTLVLLDNLLSWAKTQTGQISYSPEKLLLSSIVGEIIELSNPIARNKNILLKHSQIEKIEVNADECSIRKCNF